MSHTFGIAVKALIQNPDGKFLILFKSEIEEVGAVDFDIPGGRVERGEKLEDAIMREVKEEVGLSISLKRVIRVWGFTKGELHLVGITFLATTEKIEALQLGDEHTDFFWKSKEDILQGEFPEWLKEEILAIIDEKII